MADDGERPKCCFGVIADVQYADAPDGSNFFKTKTRYFRTAAVQLNNAITYWMKQQPSVSFVLQLGDLIDGRNNRKPGKSEEALKKTVDILSQMKQNSTSAAQVHHTVGNHDLYNFLHSDILAGPLNSSNLPGCTKPNGHSNKLYYHFTPIDGLRIVVLNTYEIGTLGFHKDSIEYKTGHDILRTYNTNKDPNDPSGLSFEDCTCRFGAYNGAISDDQLQWLDQTLTEAEGSCERVIVIGHQPVYIDSSDRSCLLWNYDKVVRIFQQHHCILAYFAGHDHDGGYAYDDSSGIHYITFQGVVDTKPEMDCFATGFVYEDRIEIVGSGRIPSYKLDYKRSQSDAKLSEIPEIK